jgi:prepilin-type N-terminal cleavage/methylation domain-containing protein
LRVRGFSLIELIIVLSIIGVINVVLFPKFTHIMDGARQISARSTARGVMVAIEEYFFIHQSYPDCSQCTMDTLVDSLKKYNLFTKVPDNPYTGEPYTGADSSGKMVYHRLSQTEYTLRVYGRDNDAIILQYP